MIKIVSLGTGDAASLTLGAMKAMRSADKLILQTGDVPCAACLREQGFEFETMDAMYEEAADFDTLSALIADAVTDADGCLFAAVGELYANGIVAAIVKKAAGRGVETAILATTACDAVARCGVFCSCALVAAASGISDITIDTDAALLVREVSSAFAAGELKLYLADWYGDDAPAYVVREDGVTRCALHEIDAGGAFDYATCVVLPPVPLLQKRRFTTADLVRVMDRLRAPGGCPWDNEQTHDTLKKYLIEESYEVKGAVESGDMDSLADELGDVLLQVVFHAKIAADAGEFTVNDVSTSECRKMILRHPHVFGDVSAETSEQVLKNWDAIKLTEKGIKSAADNLRDVSCGLPALMRAAKVQKRAADVGFDWQEAAGECAAKVAEEAGEALEAAASGDAVRTEEETGDLLFAAVNVARKLGVEPEEALMRACDKFIRRFAGMESLAAAKGRKIDEMELFDQNRLWDEVKNGENI